MPLYQRPPYMRLLYGYDIDTTEDRESSKLQRQNFLKENNSLGKRYQKPIIELMKSMLFCNDAQS
jgi:hypothetical protein